jgi:hypothetical protein
MIVRPAAFGRKVGVWNSGTMLLINAREELYE